MGIVILASWNAPEEPVAEVANRATEVAARQQQQQQAKHVAQATSFATGVAAEVHLQHTLQLNSTQLKSGMTTCNNVAIHCSANICQSLEKANSRSTIYGEQEPWEI
jgi:hypothetical protein